MRMVIQSPYGFLSLGNSNKMSTEHYHDLDLACQGRLRSNIMMGRESPCIVFCMLIIVTRQFPLLVGNSNI